MEKRSLTGGIQVLLSLVGAADAGTVYWAHRAGVDLPCSTGNGCDLVNSSHWATVAGFHVSLLGALTYVVLLFASILRLTTDSATLAARVNIFVLAVSFFGTCYSWYLQYVADVDIGAFCIYCRVSAITMTLIFIVSLVGQILERRYLGGAPTGPAAPGPPAAQPEGWPPA